MGGVGSGLNGRAWGDGARWVRSGFGRMDFMDGMDWMDMMGWGGGCVGFFEEFVELEGAFEGG